MKKQIILSCIVLASFLSTNQTQAQDATAPYVGQIKMFAGNFAPRGWAFCDGQLLAVNQNEALFSLLGTIYGGDGRTTFGLPDLRGRVPVADGQGLDLTDRKLGAKFGSENVTLTTNQIPGHNHSANITPQVGVSTDAGTELNANNQFIANHSNAFNTGATAGASLAGASSTIVVGNAGSTQSHNNMQPSLGIHYIIALVGTYPSRQ